MNYQAWIWSYKHVCLQLRIRNVRLCKTVCSGSDYCFANSYILQSHTRVYKLPSVQFPRTFSLLIIILVPVLIQSVILFLQCLIFLCSCLCLKCLIVSPSLILVSTSVCHYYFIILLVISISQIHRLVGKTPLVIFIYYF